MSSPGAGKFLPAVLLWPFFCRFVKRPKEINPYDFLTGKAGEKELDELRKRAGK